MSKEKTFVVIWALMWVLVVPYLLTIRRFDRLLGAKYPQLWQSDSARSISSGPLGELEFYQEGDGDLPPLVRNRDVFSARTNLGN